jgi:hypothetical protein
MTPGQIAELEHSYNLTQERLAGISPNAVWERYKHCSAILHKYAPDLIATAKEVERLKAERDDLVRRLDGIDGWKP